MESNALRCVECGSFFFPENVKRITFQKKKKESLCGLQKRHPYACLVFSSDALRCSNGSSPIIIIIVIMKPVESEISEDKKIW